MSIYSINHILKSMHAIKMLRIFYQYGLVIIIMATLYSFLWLFELWKRLLQLYKPEIVT